MKASFIEAEKTKHKLGKKIAIGALLFVMIFSFIVLPLKPAQAQIPVTDAISNAWTMTGTVWQKITRVLGVLATKVGSIAFQQVLKTALNKIAYDAANYIGSGGQGQKPLFVGKDWGTYLAQIGDNAAGQFVESFVNILNAPATMEQDLKRCGSNFATCYLKCDAASMDSCTTDCQKTLDACNKTANAIYANTNSATGTTASTASKSSAGGATPSFNVCQPSSLAAKVRIGLGLVSENRPQAPNCSASQMVNSWSSAGANSLAQKIADYKDPNFLNNFKGIFDPQSNDLGIYMLARTDMSSKAIVDTETSKTTLVANKGWLDVRDIAGNAKTPPGTSEQAIKDAAAAKQANFGKTTGDILVDTANVFLNQLAMSAFNNLMQNLGKKASDASNAGSSGLLANSGGDPTILYGESNLKETTQTLLQPNFGTRADYDVLSQLAICPDPKNPGPTDCVIDSQLLQAVSEKQTVAEAIKSGYLHGDWQLVSDTQASAYSLRNISILRQYRILPVGWEVAVQKAYADPVHPQKVTLNDLVSCFDPNDSYNQFSAAFNVSNQGWCQGLVDPNWVLKAPLNYCSRQGVGSQIQSKIVIPGTKGQGVTAGTLSQLSVTRADSYCGDTKTCIKEKANGSCDAYGYCNEEKRTWSFGADSCDPVYNTCQAFTKTSDGQSYAYLQNTLNYSGCDASSAGCRQYAWSGAYNTSTGAVLWDAAKSIYLNKNASQCRPTDEGCSEFLRVKPTWGANLVMDADFVNDAVGASSTGSDFLNDWPIWSSGIDVAGRQAEIVDASQEPGGASGPALKLEASGAATGQVVLGTYSNAQNPLVPNNLQIIPGQSYTLSADVYLATGDHAYVVIGDSADGTVATTTVKSSWQHLTVTRLASNTYNQPDFDIHADSNTGGPVLIYIQNVKFEMSNWDTGYSSYGATRFTEKILPPYLEKSCYQDATAAVKDYRLKSGAPAICSNYARKCNQDEVGCELYTDAVGFSLPAKTVSEDYCSKDCVGYDVYISRATYFNSPQAENMIPAQAKACAAPAVGCNEFTNLDQTAQGGEQKEYYSYLKQCIKPSQGTCANFYSWESEAGGPQLKAYNLKAAASGAPDTTSADSALCNAVIYNLPVNDPGYNADCRQFYNQAGQVSYHLASYVITCSDNCHAYRMTQINQDKTLTQAQCTGGDKNWDSASNACDVCQNGGLWNTDHKACVYQAIPGEGAVCKAEENGCREYNGNTGHNTRLAAYYDYENGLSGWYSNCAGGVSISTISNNRNGHSLQYNSNATQCLNVGEENTTSVSRQPLIKKIFAADSAAAQLKVGNLVTQGLSYNVKFLARADADANLQIYFLNKDTGAKAYFNAGTALTVAGGGDWQLYTSNLPELDHKVGANEILVISADKKFFLDDFILTEITNRYYLIQNSSVIPDVCYYDTFGNYQGANFNLGCSAYTDRNNLTHNLHKFSQICSDSAVGCEQMIATNNYSPYKSGIWNDTNGNGSCDANEPDCVKVAGDTALYAVYDQTKLCNAADLGCSRLGQKQATGDWSDTFYNNNPNNYDQSLCGSGAVGCEEWSNSDNGFSYFRDPGNNTCIYRTSKDPTVNGKAWYKIAAKRCDLNANGVIDGTEKTGAICNSNTDCGTNTSGASLNCVADNNDYPCGVSYFKTIGSGGAGNQVPTPDGSAGLCDAAAAGCTEYIDPVSQFSPNLVYNSEFKTNGEGWGPSGGKTWNGAALSPRQQVIKLDPNKLYIFLVQPGAGTDETKLDFLSGVKPLLSDNTLGTTTNSLSIPAGANKHISFSSMGNAQALVTGGMPGKAINVKEAALGYQLAANVDKQSCNGLTKFDTGCVLFNERTYGTTGVKSLNSGWDAYKTLDGQAPVACDATQDGSCTANQLVKVRPDRVCSKWLDCVTYVTDPATGARTCYALGECTRLDDKGECANFENTPNPSPTDLSGNKNATGYFLVNNYYPSNMVEVGLNTDGHFDFEDSVPALSCSRPGTTAACVFNTNIAKDTLVREPEGAPTDYPAHGKTYLKVPVSYLISPHSANSGVSVLQNKDYYLNYLVNTRNSGAAATITIKGFNGTTQTFATTTTATAINGWERKIFKFTTAANTKMLKIYLGSDNPGGNGYVYFDDINIEPVLQIGLNQYAARECRLYPAGDSLTCTSKNNNTVTDGWEGYCLQHDKDNPSNCLLWYPVDSISSSQTNQSSATGGYDGKYPLNYCTEANGNFDLVEKRVPVKIAEAVDDSCSGGCTVVSYECGGDPNYIKVAECVSGQNKRLFCIPNPDKLLIKKPADAGGNSCHTSFGGIKVYEGWGKYEKTVPADSQGFLDWADNGGMGCEEGGCGKVDEAKNADPPIQVYDYSRPPADEEGLKLITSSDPDKAFRLTCNQFTQVVDENGSNMAWAIRTGVNSVWATQTPPYFVNSSANYYYGAPSASSPKGINLFGRNREDLPFGAAVWPDDFNLLSGEPVPFRNEYSKKNSENIFAGRPYGCTNGSGSGCGNIGYCSLDPSVYCFVATPTSTVFSLEKKTCADGGYGTCLSLWKNNLGNQDFKDILRTLFLKTYNTFGYQNGYYGAGQNSYNASDTSTLPLCTSARYVDTYGWPATLASFCAIYPQVGSSVAIKFNNQVISTSTVFNALTKGVYRLEFTSQVDPEQAPLKEIHITWGDQTEQTIVNVSPHPSSTDPNIFYHYYKTTGSKTILIDVKDNWDRFGSSPTCGGGTCFNYGSIYSY